MTQLGTKQAASQLVKVCEGFAVDLQFWAKKTGLAMKRQFHFRHNGVDLLKASRQFASQGKLHFSLEFASELSEWAEDLGKLALEKCNVSCKVYNSPLVNQLQKLRFY